MSHPYERPPVPIANLTAEDHALLAHIADEQFALRHVVGNSIHLHPAQQTLLTLTQWLKLPHIAAAARELQADLREYESVRLEFLQRHSIDGLVDAMHSASRNLKLLEESRTHNAQHTRAVEELRLAAQALNRATKPGATAPSLPAPGVPAPGGTGLQTGVPSASRATDPSSDQCGSSSPPRPQGERELPGCADRPAAGGAIQPLESATNSTSALCADELISQQAPTSDNSSPSTPLASPSPRSPDAQTCDDIPHSATAPLCHSATSSSDSTPSLHPTSAPLLHCPLQPTHPRAPP